MDEKNQIKISLGTVICVFIIAILIIIIGVMYFHYNYNLNENRLSNENQNIAVGNSNDLVSDDIINVKYVCEIFENHFLDEFASLRFYPNKTFDVSIGNYNYPGMTICDGYDCSGTYEIEDNKIKCIIKEAAREGYDKYTQNIEFVLEYNKNENTMRTISISSNKIQLYSFADENRIEEVQLTVLKENNIFEEYVEKQAGIEEQYFERPMYFALNGNEDDAILFVWGNVGISKNGYTLRGNIKKEGNYYIFEFTEQAFSLWDSEGSVSETLPLNANTKIKVKYTDFTENEMSKFEIISIDTSEEQLKDIKVGDVFICTGTGL